MLIREGTGECLSIVYLAVPGQISTAKKILVSLKTPCQTGTLYFNDLVQSYPLEVLPEVVSGWEASKSDQPVKPTHSFVDRQHYSGSIYQPQSWHKVLKAPAHKAASQAWVKASEWWHGRKMEALPWTNYPKVEIFLWFGTQSCLLVWEYWNWNLEHFFPLGIELGCIHFQVQ